MEDLPVEVMVDILSRLAVKTIIQCKCVCKKWGNIVLDSYFADLHLSRSPASIMVHHQPKDEIIALREAGILKWVEVEDELDHHHLHYDPVMSIDLNLTHVFQERNLRLVGSVNGLICMWKFRRTFDDYFLCNPITREYISLPPQKHYNAGYALVNHGFGVGSLTQEYKVIRIYRDHIPMNPTSTSRVSLSEAEVYTLGTGQWRSLGHVPYCINGYSGLFLNGNAHWAVSDKDDSDENLYAFDFDNETFKLFPSPPVETIEGSHIRIRSLGVLKGCLCQCDTLYSQFTIWVMKEYGIKTSWHKEFVIMKESIITSDLDRLMWAPLYLIEGLCDGTILMVYSQDKLLAYSSERRTIADTGYFDRYFTGMAYRPSFLKLRNLESERVHVF